MVDEFSSFNDIRTMYKLINEWQEWTLSFVSKPNVRLNRKGAVCPCMSKVLMLESSMYKVITMDYALDQKNIFSCIDDFKVIEYNVENAELRKILNLTLLITNFNKSDLKSLEDIHKKLKLEFVLNGFMIGDFYPGCKKSSARNDSFFPMDSPIAAFVIRRITPHDILFLNNSEYDTETREKLIKAHSEYRNAPA